MREWLLLRRRGRQEVAAGSAGCRPLPFLSTHELTSTPEGSCAVVGLRSLLPTARLSSFHGPRACPRVTAGRDDEDPDHPLELAEWMPPTPTWTVLMDVLRVADQHGPDLRPGSGAR